MADRISIIKQMYLSLTDKERLDFLSYLKDSKEDNNELKSFNSIKELILKHNHTNLNDRPSCPHCRSLIVVKNGHKDGNQRYKCKDCHKTFAITNNTILFSTKKSITVWQKFCGCLLNKFSLRKCASICDINLHTAFNWRHKILDALQNMQSEVKLNGVIQSDETYFPLSFKGHHKHFTLPRSSRKRGHSSTVRGLSKELVCVPCTVNLNGLSVGVISNLGKPNVFNLEKALNHKFENGSILVTDSFKAYQKIAFENDLTHVRIHRGKHSNGSFNIQTVNSYHCGLKRMIEHNFRGVATKYLNNYIVYNNFVNFSKSINKLDILENFVFSTKCNSKGYEIVQRDPIPVL